MSKLSLELAKRIVDSLPTLSESNGGPRFTIAVCDAGGHLVALTRQDGALLASLEVAQTKARTAVYFGTSTANLPFDKPFTPALLGAVSDPLAFLPGGLPILVDGVLIGGVGVGGGTAEQDAKIAELALGSTLSS